jgi:hypothetical protein
MAEEAFYFVGTLADAREKTKASNTSGDQRKS